MSPAHFPASPRSACLGRDHELGALEAGLDALGAGHGALFLVTGEPGIGKTRLCDELARAATARGVAVSWGRAWEAGGAPAYWPIVQALRGMCRGLDAHATASLLGDRSAALAELLPELRPRDVPRAEAPLHEQFELFDAVGGLVHALAAAAPQVVVLDDLHAADPSSLLLLSFLVRDLRSHPMLLLGTYRDAEARRAPEVREMLARIAREGTVLPLRRLDREQVGELVRSVTGAAPSADAIAAMHRRSEGNPLFVHELIRLTGSRVQPDGIRAVVAARLALLGPPAREALEVGAVLGRELPLVTVAAMLDTSVADLEDRLAPAVDGGIVEGLEGSERWRFTHVLLREGLYASLDLERRRALHRSAAASLRARGDEPLAQIAHHLLAAIPAVSAAEAVDAALRAAERAMELVAFEDATALLTRARTLLEGVAGEEPRLFEVLLALGGAQIRAADVEAGVHTCRRAAGVARELGDGERFARAVLGSTYEFTPGVRDETAIALLEEALDMLPPGDGTLRARCMAQLAAERQPEPDPRAPIELARAAVAMARRVGDAATLRGVLTSAGMAMLVFADPDERAAIDGEVLQLALAAGDKRLALRARLFLSTDDWERGEMARADAHIRAYLALADQLPHGRFRWTSVMLRTVAPMREGRFDVVRRLYAEALALLPEDESRGTSMIAVPVGLCRSTERYDGLGEIEARVRAAFGSLRSELSVCIGEMLVAHLHASAGDRTRAAEQIATVRVHPLFPQIVEASWLALLAEACHLVGDVPLAERLYPVLLPRAERFCGLGPLGPCVEPPYARQLGLLAWTLGRLDAAVDHLAEAEERSARVGMRSHLARMRYELAGVLLARGADGDRPRATELLARASAIARELDQQGLLPLIEARTREAEAADAATVPGDTTPETPVPQPDPPTRVASSQTGAPASFALAREGDCWAITSGSRTVRLRDSRGLEVLAKLVASPGREFHVLQLISDPSQVDGGDAGSVLDDDAVQSYRGRLLELREQLDEAESFGDAGRADRARTEIDFLTRELAGAVGLGGQARRSGGAAERARTTVQKRLRGAIRRIEDELPELGRHLAQTISTGAFCGYLPEGRRERRAR